MKKITMILFILVNFCSYAQEGTTYYNEQWKITTKDQAAYYRPSPQKENELWLIKDYYITGELQFEGHSKAKDKELWDGDITWYFPNGRIEDKYRYKNGKLIGVYEPKVAEGVKDGAKEAAKDGTIAESEKGYLEKELQYYHKTGDVYYAQPNPNNVKDAARAAVSEVESAKDAIKTAVDIDKYYYEGTQKIAELNTRYYGYEDKTATSVYYDKNGKIIGKLKYDNQNDPFEGVEIIFYQADDDSQQYSAIKTITTYQKGKKTALKEYNKQGKQIAAGVLQNESPYKGTFARRRCNFYTISTYSEAKLIKTKTYNAVTNKLLAKASYKNETIYKGTSYDCDGFYTYKNGKRNGVYKIFGDGDTVQEEGNYSNGKQTTVWYFVENDDNEVINYNRVKYTIDGEYLSQVDLYKGKQLVKSFPLEALSKKQLTYDEIDFASMQIKDYNFDGKIDFSIRNNYHNSYEYQEGETNQTLYYLFDESTNSYKYWENINKILTTVPASEVDFDSNSKMISLNLRQWYDEDEAYFEYLTVAKYKLTKNDQLIKQTVIVTELITIDDKEKTATTQLYPAQIDKYPLLDSNLPKITFAQDGEKYNLDKEYQEISLNRNPFSLQFPMMEADEFVPKEKQALKRYYTTKIMASTDEYLLDLVHINSIIEGTYFLNNGNGLACENDELCLDDEGFNNLVYQNTPDYDNKLIKINKLNSKVSVFEFKINRLFFEEGKSLNLNVSTPNKLYQKPLYLLIFIDKNLDNRIEKNELQKVKLTFN